MTHPSGTFTITDKFQGYSGGTLTLGLTETCIVEDLVRALRLEDSFHFLTRKALLQIVEEIDISILIDEPLPIFCCDGRLDSQKVLKILAEVKLKILKLLATSPANSFEIM